MAFNHSIHLRKCFGGHSGRDDRHHAPGSKAGGRGTAPGRISVIYRETRAPEELTAYFRLMNIPVYSKRSLNLFDSSPRAKVSMVIKIPRSRTGYAFQWR